MPSASCGPYKHKAGYLKKKKKMVTHAHFCGMQGMIRKSYYALEPGMTFALSLCDVYKVRKVDCVRGLPVTV